MALAALKTAAQQPPSFRPYQDAALAGITQALVRGRSTLLVLATGCGKTVVFAELARLVQMRGERVLVLAHRDELLKQAARKLEAVGLHADLEKGSHRAGLCSKVVVASVQTLRGARLARFPRGHFGLIVVDEAHHAMAPGYRAVLDYFELAKILGVTATPDRLDGRALGEAFETVAFRYDLREAIAAGWLTPITARRIVVESIDLSAIKLRAGDLAPDQLAAVMETERAIQGVVVPLLELARDRRTLVFGAGVPHAHALADALNRYRPGAARALDGETPDHEREQLLADHDAGRFQFLCNCGVLTEGYDSPGVSCIAIVRPTKSRALVTQIVGRGTRLAPGKTDCLVLDFTGIVGKHRLVGPADALAGRDLPEDIAAEIHRLIGSAQLPLAAVLDAADGAAERSRAAIQLSATVRYLADDIDPFIGRLNGRPTAAGGSGGAPATDAQLAALERAGVTLSKLPRGFALADAQRILAAFEARATAGLCSYAQAKRIKRAPVAHIDTRTMTAARARELILILKAHGWQSCALRDQPEARRIQTSDPTAATGATA